MSKLSLAIAVWGGLAIAIPTEQAWAGSETIEAKEAASTAAAEARAHMFLTFGHTRLKNGQFVWKPVRDATGPARLVIGLSDQRVYLYRGDRLVAASTISSGEPGRDTPTGFFEVLDKQKFHRSIKYDNAPMPHMQRIDKYGIALHGGHLPGHPASHGCIRLPPQFAAKLFGVTELGTPVLIGS